MRKRIGTKIIFLVGILSLIFILFGVSNVTAISEINARNREISDVYLELRKIEGKMSVQVQEFRNFMDTAKLKAQGSENIKKRAESLQEFLDKMDDLCSQTSDQTLNDTFTAYKEHFEEFMSLGVSAAETIEGGDILSTLAILGDLRD